ncbi:MAG: DNA gyrase subunit A [Anaerolineae bacterium]
MEIGTIKQSDIREEMQGAYLDYAMSVITARALPDVRDGLKPVQRRILFGMWEMGLRHNTAYKKSARIVGDVLGRYHPHGDQAVYDALVRMAQDFTMRYPLIDGQGNFGSVDNDPPAAMRYTEARLTELAEEMLLDIEKDTVDFRPNFDETMKEPTVLPAKVPNLLLNGAAGIAVGMATLVPPHNLREIVDATNYLIEHWNKVDDIEPDDLMQFVKGPDFPTGGIILGMDGIKEAYATGKGRIMVRAKIHTEQAAGGRSRIIVTELPYQVNKSALIERIAELVRDRKIEEIGDLRDESDRQGMSIIIELKRGVEPTPVINQLLKHTQLQTGFSLNMLALVDGEPRVLSLKRVLQLYVQHRQVVLTRRSQYELERAKMRAHILEGLKIALDYLDEVIRTIRQSPDVETARERLMKRFKLTEIQATAILDMQLRRLAALERKKIEDELAEVHKRIRYLEDLLHSPKKILVAIQEEIGDLKERFGDARRTFIAASAETEFKEEAHADEAENLVVVTRENYIRRSGLNQFRRTRKDAEKGVASREDDPVIHLFAASTHDNLVLLTNRGRAIPLRMSQVPDVDRNPTGLSLKNQLEGNERIIAALPINNAKFLTLATAFGKIKRTAIEEFNGIQSGGTRAINLGEGDELGWAHVTQGGGNLLLVTAQGQALRFEEEEVPVQGRAAAGVWAIKLAGEDRVAGLDYVVENEWLALATAQGLVKRIALKEFPVKGRYTSGVGAITPDSKSGPVIAARVVDVEDDVMFITRNGGVVRIRADNIVKGSRSARAKPLVELKGDDVVETLVSLVGRLDRQAEEQAPESEGGEAVKEATVKALPAVTGNGHAPQAEKDGDAGQGKKGKRGAAEEQEKEETQSHVKAPESKTGKAKRADEEKNEVKPRAQAEDKKAKAKESDQEKPVKARAEADAKKPKAKEGGAEEIKPKAQAQAEGKKGEVADEPERQARAQEEAKPKAKEPLIPEPKASPKKPEPKKEPAAEKQMELELPVAGFKPLPKKKK